MNNYLLSNLYIIKEVFYIKKIFLTLIIIFITYYLYIPLSYADSNYIWDSNVISTSSEPITNLELEAESAILIDEHTGQIL